MDRYEILEAIAQVAAICFAILEREEYAPRHYDVRMLDGFGK